MIGQSNMAGRGFLQDVSPIENEHLFMLRNGRWQPLADPVNYDRPFAGVGPGPSFAEEYYKAFGREVGLIPCADGGTTISEWAPGGLLYDNAVMTAKLALRTSELKGILWHQGESDSDRKEDAEQYIRRIVRFFQSLLRDLELSNRTPILIGELGHYLGSYTGGCDYFETVNQALRDFAGSWDQCGFVSAEGLTSNPDFLHFNAVSQREFGRRYFNAYCDVINRLSKDEKGDSK